jgi:methylthioribose-1-phosphate isomerase
VPGNVPSDAPFETVRWQGSLDDGCLVLLDQTKLPLEQVEVVCHDVDLVAEAIETLMVRGAPAIGVAAAYGVVLGVRPAGDSDRGSFQQRLQAVIDQLGSTRPTAVNLFRSLRRLERVAAACGPGATAREVVGKLFTEACAIHAEDQWMCREIGRHGAELLEDGMGVLTHCNAGALATGGRGTALAVVLAAHESGKRLHVYVDETRPLLQGSRLTAWELTRYGIDSTVLCDSAAASLMRRGRVQAVVVGADRIAGNGDTANKVGTYGLALAAEAHGVPFYVAAPSSTFDLSLADGASIPIEERASEEITHFQGRQVAAPGVRAYNPAFDVTPARLIRAIISERGRIEPVSAERIADILG